MPNISLPTGKVIQMSTFDWLFTLSEEDVDAFYQSCIAEDLGKYVEDPFSGSDSVTRVQIEEVEDIPQEDIGFE